MELTNGGFLSADEYGMPTLSIVFLILQSILLLGAVIIARILAKNRKFHFTVKVVVVSVLFQFLAAALSTVYWVRLNNSGVKTLGIYFASMFMLVLANYFIILNLILVAKGWTVVRKSISTQGKVKIVAASSFYILAVIFACVYEVYSYDASIITFRYAQPPGILYAFLRILAWLWFLRALRTTFLNYSRKKRFYRKFTIFFSIWLMLLPLLALVTISLNPMTQTLFLNAWEYTLVFIGQFILLLLYNPVLKYNSSFPFHQRVEEISGGAAATVISKNADDVKALIVNSASNNQAEVFDDIRGIGGTLVKKMLGIAQLNTGLLGLLRDWDGEIEDDTDY